MPVFKMAVLSHRAGNSSGSKPSTGLTGFPEVSCPLLRL